MKDENEEWRDVPSYEGVMASSLGRVLLPSRTYRMPNGGFRTTSPKPTAGHMTKASRSASHVYYGIYNRTFGNMKVHRLVCEAFHGAAPFDGAVVIHINENPLDNRPENLKWGSQKENLNCEGFLEYCRSRTGDKSPVSKGIRIRRLDEDTSSN